MDVPRAERFDYIIIGAGSAGCVLANRLSAACNTSVLLLEAGGSDNHPYVRAPAGFLKTFHDPRFNWCFNTEPGPGVDDRRVFFPRGKVLGGSSSISGHLYVRGQARDYDAWSELGNKGWSYDDVLPYFRKSEDRSTGATHYHGIGGPQHVSDIHEHHPLCQLFIRGVEELGIPLNPDYNGTKQEGIAYYQRMIKNGRRHSAANGFLHPIKRRSNLCVKTKAHVLQLRCSGREVTGVTYQRFGRVHQADANAEVLLCAGAISSPHLLQTSGIGPADTLQAAGINVVHELPGVGEGLQDHYAVRVAYRINKKLSLNHRTRGVRLGWEISKWLLSGRGLLAFSPAHVGLFLRSQPNVNEPDLQFVFTPASYSQSEGAIGTFSSFPGVTCGIWQMRPQSRGFVRAKTPDPFQAPAIQPNYLVDDKDCQSIVQGLIWCRRLLTTKSMLTYLEEESIPGKDCQTEDELLSYARSSGGTVYHPVGTCRMGNDPMAVVNNNLEICNMGGIRIVDASIMPTMVSANTLAATLMIAEKASDLILSRRPQ